MSFCTFVSALFFIAVLCSDPTAAGLTRIVNGTTALNGQYPYQASLRTLTNSHFCGGSIVRTNWVLTAAHCLEGSTSFKVVVGTNTLLSGGYSFLVATSIQHPSYNPNIVIYDVGVVKTTTNITFSSSIKPISLATVLPSAGSLCVVTGWGLLIYPSNVLPNQLQALNTTYITRTDCQNRISSLNYPLSDTQICAFRQQTGICMGDSGGALISNNTQIGIVSLSYPCARGVPDIYTNVPYLISWIQSKIG